MKIWELSVKRPIFMSCVLAALLVVGFFSFKKTPIELFPDVTFPIVTVTTVYQGAGPVEVETLVSKPIEEELSTIAGIKNIRSVNRESVSVVIAEFNLDMDIKYAEQQVRDKVSSVKSKLPDDTEEAVIRKVDPSAQPIMVLAVKSKLQGAELYDLANEKLKSQFEQIPQVGNVGILGGRKREIQVQLDRNKLNAREISVSQVVGVLRNLGENIPAGKLDQTSGEQVYRTLGEFNSVAQIKDSLVSFYGNDVTTKISDVGAVVDTLADEKLKAYLNGEESIFLYIYKQSGANTIAVSDNVYKKITRINAEFQQSLGDKDFTVSVVRDSSKYVWANVYDVTESIIIGIILTIVVVFLFLGSFRSTVITGLAIPFSLIGSMSLLYLFGVSINIMSLLAFSLAVGLLIDDAIVVRENIFRHLEMGKKPLDAALDGTAEVGLAVIAVTLAVLAVFGPIAFLSGVVGQFFKSFGLGICFVMIISLFDALSNAPMLSAYFGGGHASFQGQPLSWKSPVRSVLILFDRFQTRLENSYEALLKRVVRFPGITMLVLFAVIIALASTFKYIPKTFIPANDSGEFNVALELPPGTTLSRMNEVALEAGKVIRENPNVELTTLTVGNSSGQSYVADFYVKLTPFKNRSVTTTAVKEDIRTKMQAFKYAAPKVKDVDFVGAGQRPFVVNISGQDLEEIRKVGQQLFEKLEKHTGVVDPEYTDKPGLPEFQIKVDPKKAQLYGVNPALVGGELRAQIEGITATKFRQNGVEYDVRVRLQDNQRNLEEAYNTARVSNVNGRLVRISDFATAKKEVGFATINRENRARYVSIEADIASDGVGMGGVISDINSYFSTEEIKLPPGAGYRFVGQAENFQELGQSIIIAGLLGIIFIYLVLASLYESLVTPFTIMLVIPLAVFGGFFGLFVMQSTLDLFSMIGCVMLMGLATKNSIIMVDYINQKLSEGLDIKTAILQGSKTRLRPILMTSLALMAGMMPVAIGLNEASSQRTSLGIAVVSGVFISTLLTLFMIPAVFNYIETGRRWMIRKVGNKIISH